MSPIKRSIQEEGLPPEYCRPKRLRGGGGDDDDNDEQLYLDEVGMMEDEADDMEVPPEIEDDGEDNVVKVISETLPAAERWGRPKLRPNLSNKDDLNLQWLDMDVVWGLPLDSVNELMPEKTTGSRTGQVPVLRTYGVTDEGPSICVFIHGFTPYGCFAVPTECTVDPSRLGDMRVVLEKKLQEFSKSKQEVRILGIEHMPEHRSIMGFDNPTTDFLKVFVNLPNHIPTLKRLMEGGVSLPGIEVNNEDSDEQHLFAPFENNVPFVLRFMVDQGLGGAGWLTLPSRTYRLRDSNKKETHCQVGTKMSFVDFQTSMTSLSTDMCYIVHMRIRSKLILPTMISLCDHQKVNGIRLPLFAFSRWILNVKVAKGNFRKPIKILSFRLPTASQSTARTNRLFRMSLLSRAVYRLWGPRSFLRKRKQTCS